MPQVLLPRRSLLLAGLAACASWASARRAAEGLPLLLAQEAPADIDPRGWLVSEKYDGVRGYWDGRQLRFRSGLPIAAPAWFTQRLPALALDGELWFGRGRFEALSGCVRRAVPDDAEWRQLRYMVFELPGGEGTFAQRTERIDALAASLNWPQVQAVQQLRLPGPHALQRRLDEVVRGGGEGLVLHRADAASVSGRSHMLLKLKPMHDAEARVVGHEPGNGKYQGQLGALRVRTERGVAFSIGTGFSDAQRREPPPLGAVVSYRHRGHTDAGVPRFASFLRVRVREI